MDLDDHNVISACFTEVVKLRNALTDKWINVERLVSFLDHDCDGDVDYDEFYDELSQFGLTEIIDTDKVFAYMDKEQVGKVKLSTL